MAKVFNVIIGLSISFVLLGVLLPVGLTTLVAYNGTYTYANGTVAGVSSTMGTLLGTVIPILGVIGIVIAFIGKRE